MAAGAAALVGRLQDRRARQRPRAFSASRARRRSDRAQRRARPTVFAASTALATLAESWPRSASSFRNLMRSLPLAASELFEIDEHRRAIVLAGLDRERRGPLATLDREAHHGLVDRADLLDVERAIGKPLARRRLALAASSGLRECAAGSRRRLAATRGGSASVAAPFEERELRPDRTACRRAPGRNALGCPSWISRNSASKPAPAAAPLVHRVGIERGILDEPRVQAAHRIARLVDFARATIEARRQQIAILGIENEDEPHQDREQALVEMPRPVRASSRMSFGSAASSPRSNSCKAPSTCSASAVETAACASRLFRSSAGSRRSSASVNRRTRIEQQLEPAQHRPAGDHASSVL